MHERDVELAALGQFRSLGFDVRHGPDLGPDAPAAERESYERVILTQRLTRAVAALNPDLHASAIGQVVRTITQPAPHPTLIQNNRWMYTLLTEGVEVEYKDTQIGETRGGRARLIDLENAANNDFLVVSQLTVQGPSTKAIRPDIGVFINGLPLAIIELKDPADESADLWTAIDQFSR